MLEVVSETGNGQKTQPGCSFEPQTCDFLCVRCEDSHDREKCVLSPDLPRSDSVRHQTGQEDEVQDRVLPAGAAHALSEDVQGRDPLLQRHDL